MCNITRLEGRTNTEGKKEVHLRDSGVAGKGLDAVRNILSDVEIFHDAAGTCGPCLDYHFSDVEAQLTNVGLSIGAIVLQRNIAKVVLRRD